MSAVATIAPSVAHPLLRRDLEITPQETADGRSYLLHDPRSGRFCRFRELEHFIATACDGLSSSEEIRRRCGDELGTAPEPETLEKFLAQLRKLNLLQSEDEETYPTATRRIQGTLLHLRVRLFDPDRLLTRLAGPLRWLFTPEFLVLSIGFVLAALSLTVMNAAAISSALRGMARPEMIVLMIAASIVVTLLHELAHGLTCRHFGGPVHEIGALLLFFLPAFYCNVNSAWGFPRKGQRMWVTLAGPWSSVLIWAAAIFVWRFSLPGSRINTAALLAQAVTGLETFINLNPLIKLDGYYLLSDWLEIPNLRSKAFRHLAAVLGFARPDASLRSRNQRLILLAYGLLGTAFSVGLLGLVTVKVGGFLMNEYQELGFVAALSVVGLLIRGVVMKAVAWPFRTLVGSTSVLRRVPRAVWSMTALAVPFAGVWFCPGDVTVVGDVEVRAGKNAEIRAQTDGLISAVHVQEGDQVAAGSSLVSLVHPERQTQLARIQSEIAGKRAELEELRSGVTAEEIQLAKAAVATSQTAYQHALLKLEEAKRMHEAQLRAAEADVRQADSARRLAAAEVRQHERLLTSGAISASELERLKGQLAEAEAKWDAARANVALVQANRLETLAEQSAVAHQKWKEETERLNVLLAEPKPTAVAAIEAEIAGLVAQRDHLQNQLKQQNVSSLIAGTVTTPRMDELVHHQVNQGDLIAEVQELDFVKVDLAVPEHQIGNVVAGREVLVRVLAWPDREFRGEVTHVAPAASEGSDTGGIRTFTVTTRIDNPTMQLRPGMTGKAKILTGRRHGLGSIALDHLARAVQVRFWSWWPRF